MASHSVVVTEITIRRAYLMEGTYTEDQLKDQPIDLIRTNSMSIIDQHIIAEKVIEVKDA